MMVTVSGTNSGDSMSRTPRLLEVLIKLQTRPSFTVQELAGELGVSRRTMLRDLHALSEMGVPLASAPGPHGGYTLIARRRLLPLSLTADEAIGMVLSYEAFLQYAQSPFSAQSLSAITKLRNAIPPDVVHQLDRIHQHVVVAEPVRSYDAPFLPDVLRAALDGVHLRISYDSRSGVAERLIYPYGLYAAHGFWYCACYDYRRGVSLGLRADRVLSLERAEGLGQPSPISLREWLRTRESDAELSVHLRARVSREGAKGFDLGTVFGQIEVNELGEGVIDTWIPESEVDYFATRFLLFGTEVVVESPPCLIAAIRRKARAIAELYSVSPPPESPTASHKGAL
jgi:predicted DNA-binding transcriptional regulator YafY